MSNKRRGFSNWINPVRRQIRGTDQVTSARQEWNSCGGLFNRASPSEAFAEEAPRGNTSGAGSFGREKRRTRRYLATHALRILG